MKKIKFTFTKADSKTRTMGIIALVLAVAAIVLLVVSATSALNRSITELPIIKTLVPEEQLDDVTETYDELIEEIEAAIDEEDDELLEELEDEYGMHPEEVLELLDPISLNSLKELSGIVADEMDEEAGDIVSGLFAGLVGFVNGYAILLGFLVALSALFLNKAWFITATSLSVVFFVIFVGAVWFVVFLGLCIAYSILVSKVKNAYTVSKVAEQLAATAAPATEA